MPFYQWSFNLIGNCVPEYRQDSQKIYPVGNTWLVEEGHLFLISINCGVENFRVWKDGALVYDESNIEENIVEVGTRPCAEYDVRQDERCREGYTRFSEFTYRITIQRTTGLSEEDWYRYSELSQTESIFRGFQLPNISRAPAWHELPSGTNYRERFQFTVSGVRYYCRPNVGCTDSIFETQRTWNNQALVYQDGMLAPTPAPEIPRPPQPNTPTENEDTILELIRAATESGRHVTIGPGNQLSRIERRDSKYRIISPENYSLVMGKWVPDIRYESVRYLSPEAASNFISRGYELQAVDIDTPESSSKPYSQSVIRRQGLLTGNLPKYNVQVERRRTTITGITQRQTQGLFFARRRVIA